MLPLKNRQLVGRIFVAVLFATTLLNHPAAGQELNIAPWPANAKRLGGTSEFTNNTRIVIQDDALLPLGKVLSEDFLAVAGLHLAIVQDPPRNGDISLAIDHQLKKEDYVLKVGDQTTITGANYNAVEMGTMSLLQLLKTDGGKVIAPNVEIQDGPKLEFNAYLLNTALYPYSIENLKKYIVYCQFNKIRFFQMTLSGDNGWIFPCKAFPQLGSKNWGWAGAEVPKVYDLQELKDFVAFADAHGVTIVPQIQTLGHSDSMRLAMPDTFDLPEKPGGAARMAAVNIANPDAVYPAMDLIVGEICDVFKSSPYFHIGCDEVNMSVLEKQPTVQAYLKEHNLPTVWHLVTQHYARMNELVKKHGKRTIVWEPAVDFGDLPSDLIAMPWVGGSSIAEQYVKHGIQIINAPWGVEKPYQNVYTVNAAHLKKGESLLIGGTALNWAGNFDDPVGASLFNEPIYNPDADRGQQDFFKRASVVNPIADKLMYGFAFTLAGQLPPSTFGNMIPVFEKQLTLTLDCPKGGQVRYTTDGTPASATSAVYESPIVLNKTTTVQARWFASDGSSSGPSFSRVYRQQPMIQHDALGAKVTIDPPNPGYFNGGAKSLTDGYIAASESCGDGCFLGWLNASPTITVDMGKPKEVRSVYIHFLAGAGAIRMPKTLDLQIGNDSVKLNTIAQFVEADGIKTRGWFGLQLQTPQAAQFIRAHAEPADQWVFADELIVNASPPGPSFHHAAMGKPVTVVNPADNSDPRTGDLLTPPVQALTDGYISNCADWNNPEWLTFKKDLDATIDLGAETDIHEVGATFMQHVWAGIRIPSKMEVLISENGKDFTNVATIKHDPTNTPSEIKSLSATLENARGRYVRIVVPVAKGRINVDEIYVNPD